MTAAQIRQSAIDARREELLTVKEFASITHVHPLTVYRRIREGRQAGVVRYGNRDIRIDIREASMATVKRGRPKAVNV